MNAVVVCRLMEIWCRVGVRRGWRGGGCWGCGGGELGSSSSGFGGEWDGGGGCEDSGSTSGSGSCGVGGCGGGMEVASSRDERNAVRVPQIMRTVGWACSRM